MASGVPVVQPRRGAFVEVVNTTGGGLLVDSDDADALADGLHAVWSDPALAARLGSCAFEGVRTHYTVAKAATRLLEVYDDVTHTRAPSSPVSAPPPMTRRIGA
jgi:glycosyltransferase involved in cell wall biosynthesis